MLLRGFPFAVLPPNVFPLEVMVFRVCMSALQSRQCCMCIGIGGVLLGSVLCLYREVKKLRVELAELSELLPSARVAVIKAAAVHAEAVMTHVVAELSDTLSAEIRTLSREQSNLSSEQGIEGGKLLGFGDGLARCRQLALRVQDEVGELRGRVDRAEDSFNLRLATLSEQLGRFI